MIFLSHATKAPEFLAGKSGLAKKILRIEDDPSSKRPTKRSINAVLIEIATNVISRVPALQNEMSDPGDKYVWSLPEKTPNAFLAVAGSFCF